jgi:hypothetical protein
MTKIEMTDMDTKKPFTTVMATYFSVYSWWLNTSFNGLEITDDWGKKSMYTWLRKVSE